MIRSLPDSVAAGSWPITGLPRSSPSGPTPTNDVAQLGRRETIERKHGVGWHTVQAALKSPNPPARKKYPARTRPGLHGLEPHIDALLADKPTIPVREIWEHLLDEHQAAVTYEAVRGYLADRRGPTPRPPLPVTGNTETAATTGLASTTAPQIRTHRRTLTNRDPSSPG
ncbi:hypothetical protein AB0E01_18130 [Nocardia vinacea]|uniref:hypothetical protein n=1 Tax=Nocardia vinacea TaxID=96468 RepID=UPI0033E01F31